MHVSRGDLLPEHADRACPHATNMPYVEDIPVRNVALSHPTHSGLAYPFESV